jgi:hypothetical protein
VEIEGKTNSSSSGSHDLPEGRLHFYTNSNAWIAGMDAKAAMEELKERRKESKQKRMLKLGLMKRDEKQDQKWFLKDSEYGRNCRKGIQLLYGDEKLKEATEKVEKGEYLWLIQLETGIYREVVTLSKRVPFTEKQLEDLRSIISERKLLLKGLYAAYQICRKEKTEETAEFLFEAFDLVTKHENETYKTLEEMKTPIQKMLLKKDWMKGGSSSGGFEDEMGEVHYQSVKGRFNASVSIRRTKAGKYVPYFIDRVLGEALGKEVKCTVDDKLKDTNISGKIKFRSVQDGLDKLAKLMGAKLVKNEDGSYTIINK